MRAPPQSNKQNNTIMKKAFKLLLLALAGTFALASCEDVPAPYPNPNPDSTTDGTTNEQIDPAGTGTLADPFNVAGVVEYCNSLGADVESSEVVYVKGKVATNTTSEATITQYGNMTFTLIDEGNTKTTFTAFQVYGPGKKKFTSVDQIKEGDEVIICGKVVNYKGNTPETVGKGAAYVYSINSEGGIDVPDTPTDAIEVTCAKAAELTSALADGATSDETYSVTGYITDVFGNVSRNQQSFWMADTKDGGKVLQAYWANLPAGVEAFTKGSKVKITGQLLKYVKDGAVTPEIKNADVVILEAGNDTPDTPETPSTGTPEGDGTQASPFNVAGINAYMNGQFDENKEVYITGVISKFKSGEEPGNSYGNATFYISEDGKTGGEDFYCYRIMGFNGEKFSAQGQLKVGDKVVIKSPVTIYTSQYGSTKETVQGKGQLVSVNGKAEYSSGDQGGNDQPSTPTIDPAELTTDVVYALGDNASENAACTINGVTNVKTIKIGTSSKVGAFTITAPSSGKVCFYAVTWKGAGTADVQLKDDANVVKTVSVKANDGATGNAPFTMTVSEADKYEVEVPAGKTITLTSDKRIIFFGIQSK